MHVNCALRGQFHCGFNIERVPNHGNTSSIQPSRANIQSLTSYCCKCPCSMRYYNPSDSWVGRCVNDGRFESLVGSVGKQLRPQTDRFNQPSSPNIVLNVGWINTQLQQPAGSAVLHGVGSGPADTICPDVVGEIYFVHQRGRAMVIYSV